MTDGMRALHWLLAIAGVALLATVSIVLSIPSPAPIAAQRFSSATLCIEALIDTPYSRAGLSALLSPAPPASCSQVVALPNRSRADAPRLTRSSAGLLGRAWYRIHYDIPVGWKPDDLLMIYSPRVLGFGWQVRVNERIAADNLDDWRMTWNRPIAVTLNSTDLRPGDRIDVAVGIAFEPQVGFALTRISVGPSSALTQRVATRTFLQFGMPIACSVTLLTMGVFFFLFWLSRRVERTHLYLALSCIAWCVCNLQYVLPRRDDPALNAWYSAVAGPSITWVMWLVYLFVLQLDARFPRAIAVMMPPFVLLMTVLALPVVPLNEFVGVFYQGANVAVAAIIAGRIAWTAIRGGSLELRVITLALAIVILAGVHDVGLLAQRLNPEGIYLLPYSSLLLFGSLLFAVQRRYVHAINDFEHLSGNLAKRLSEREVELHANHQRLLEFERAHTLSTERHRLMHDMHDGLGAALSTSLAMIEQVELNRAELKNLLLESVDDLRSVIDSLEPLDGDLISVLATLRFRFGKRLELAGIAIEWDMQDLPALAWLGPPQALQLIRIVQEVLTNVLKHSAATRLRISAHCKHPDVEVCIADNGMGFNIDAVAAGRGVRNLRQRAASLSGRIAIESRLGTGTTIRLVLPIARS
jgi:signal transduction histidine kinase